tara:strand:+ start:187 stop:393 length:207 start_codon:yes stop_codon:yes gene_type:complete
MKFIPGTRFINRTNNNTRLFYKNVIYILNDIKKVNGEIIYIFLVNKEKKEVKFKSIEEADNWLETILF